MLTDITPDELRALLAVLPAPLRGLDPDEPGLSKSLREYRAREQHYISAHDKIKAALSSIPT